MSATVKVNDRTVVHETSGGCSLAFPDICIVPSLLGGQPVPFPNLGLSADAANTSATVYADGKCIMLKDSFFARTYGDEAGTGGGIISGCFSGKASFLNYSYDVMVEGRNVARLFDPMAHNHGSPPNVLSPAEFQANIVGDEATKWFLCEIFCACLAMGEKEECCRQALADRWDHYDPDAGRMNVRDPRYPGLYVEVPFDRGNPPRPMMVKDWDGTPGARSNNPFMRDPTDPGKGMPLPGGDSPPVPGSQRPDVVKVRDPNKPIDDPDNIDSIYDFKFPPPTWHPGQREGYEEIAPGRVFEISLEQCSYCRGKKQDHDKPWQPPFLGWPGWPSQPGDKPADPKDKPDDPEEPKEKPRPPPRPPQPQDQPGAALLAAIALLLYLASRGQLGSSPAGFPGFRSGRDDPPST